MGNRLIFLYFLDDETNVSANTGNLVWLFKHNSTPENRNGEKVCKM